MFRILDYDVSNSGGSVPVSQYDFFGVVAHEFSEIMGRQMMDGEDFAGAPGYTALDLFHYSAPGIPDFSGTTPGYFSPNGGFTNLGNFNTDHYGDFGDWAGNVGNNAYLAYSKSRRSEPRYRVRPYSYESARLGFNIAIGSAGDYCGACSGS